MTSATAFREAARDRVTGEFGEHRHSHPDVTLAGTDGGRALDTIQALAPIGARTARLVIEWDGDPILFSRYEDQNGRGVPITHAEHMDITDTLYLLTPASLASRPGVVLDDRDGETWITIALKG